MSKITIYLPERLGAQIQAASKVLNLSSICQEALAAELYRLSTTDEEGEMRTCGCGDEYESGCGDTAGMDTSCSRCDEIHSAAFTLAYERLNFDDIDGAVAVADVQMAKHQLKVRSENLARVAEQNKAIESYLAARFAFVPSAESSRTDLVGMVV